MPEADHIIIGPWARIREKLKRWPERHLLLGLSLVVGLSSGLAAVLLK